MDSTLTWLDLTASDRDRMQRVLDLFKEQGTVDEMGLGTLRDALSNVLFPGITSIQTRLRYALFIPWIYQMLEDRHIPSERVSEEARRAEVRLIYPLSQSQELGVIGINARGSLRRLPSSVYWSCLRRWGIFQLDLSQSAYHSRFTQLRTAATQFGRADDPGVTWQGRPNWHPRLPKRPMDFPDRALFDLTSSEALFVQGRIEERCTGTLLAHLASRSKSQLASYFWEEPEVLRANDRVQSNVELARRFSLHVEGMPLIYNLMLAEMHRNLLGDDKDGSVVYYTEACREWVAREAREEDAFEPGTLWALVESQGSRVNPTQRLFVETWTDRLAKIDLDKAGTDEYLRSLIADRERALKGRHRARLLNTNRLLDWKGGSGVGRMDFNWFRARELLGELYRGLG
ncbi:MAG: DUF6361 family protein [Gammaproteobacteria bacterium]|nr:DUF6361 family protein [Gammaproteobacteria bacterium]